MSKTKGQRLGQLVTNAMYLKYKSRWHGTGTNTDEFHNYLFYMENDEFVKMISDYLETVA